MQCCWRKRALVGELSLSCRSGQVRPALGSKNAHMTTRNSSAGLNGPLPAAGSGCCSDLAGHGLGGALKLNVLAKPYADLLFVFCLFSLGRACTVKCYDC